MWCFTQWVNGWLTAAWYEALAGSDVSYAAVVQEGKWNDPRIVAAVQTAKDWMDKGWFSGDPETSSSLDYDSGNFAIADGTALFTFEGTWAFGRMKDNFAETGMEWDWTQMPAGDNIESVYQLAIGQNLSINMRSEHPDATAEVLDWLLNDKKRAAAIVEAGDFGEWVVPLIFEREDFSAGADERNWRYMDEFAKVTGAGRTGLTTWTFWPPEAASFNHDEFDNVWRGDWTAQEFCDQLQEVYEEAWAEGSLAAPPRPDVEPSP